MANIITNRLTVTGDNNEVSKLFAGIYGGMNEYGKEMLLDFNKLVPMPESLNIDCSSQGKSGLKLYSALCGKAGFPLRFKDVYEPEQLNDKQQVILESLILGEQYHNNIRDYGHPTWYEWASDPSNWGTKWNASDQTRVSDNCIEFQTAWCGVSNLIEKLSGMYPSVTLTYMYADEDRGNNLGEYVFEGGCCVDVNIPQSQSPEAMALATEILGEPYQESDCEDDMEI